MAPPNTKGNRSILSFFVSSSRWNNGEESDDNIVVSSASARREPTSRPPAPPPSASTESSIRGRGRPRKSQTGSSPSSSQSSSSGSKSKHDRKIKSQQMRDKQLRSSSPIPVSSVTPPRSQPSSSGSPLDGSNVHATSKTLSRRREVVGVDISSSPRSSSRGSNDTKAPSPPSRNTISPSNMGNALSNAFGSREAISRPLVPTASASSISTLTTVPPSSGAPLPGTSSSNASRRVTRDGLQGVIDSDSDDDTSSSDGLPDLPTSFRPLQDPEMHESKRRRISPPANAVRKQAPKKSTPGRQSSRLSDHAKSFSLHKNLSYSPAKHKHKNSLADLVRQHEQWRMSEAMIASLDEQVEQACRKEKLTQQFQETEHLDKDALVKAAGSDSDEQARMVKALRRTEALKDEERYYFFLDGEPQYPDEHFPVDSLPDEPWSRIYGDDSSRTNACLSGFATELARSYALPTRVTGWMVGQLQYEPNEALRESYVQVLQASCAHDSSVSVSCASINSLYWTRSMFEHGHYEGGSKDIPHGLQDTLRVLKVRAPSADNVVPDSVPSWTCAAILDLALMNVDERVRASTKLCLTIASCIEEMLDALPEISFDRLIPEAIGTFFAPSGISKRILCRAVVHLPVGTGRAHFLRRRLALGCFANAAQRKIPESPGWARLIEKCLETEPEFQITDKTDYRLLTDLISVLDIAIAAGWTDHAELVARKASGPRSRLSTPLTPETTHDAQIDSICARLQSMASKIRDSGTSHLGRVEAKTTIECLVKRLEHTVRSRPKPKKGVFGSLREGKLAFQSNPIQAAFIGAAFGAQPESVAPVESLPEPVPGPFHIHEVPSSPPVAVISSPLSSVPSERHATPVVRNSDLRNEGNETCRTAAEVVVHDQEPLLTPISRQQAYCYCNE